MAQRSILVIALTTGILKAQASVAAFVAIDLFWYFAAVYSNMHLQKISQVDSGNLGISLATKLWNMKFCSCWYMNPNPTAFFLTKRKQCVCANWVVLSIVSLAWGELQNDLRPAQCSGFVLKRILFSSVGGSFPKKSHLGVWPSRSHFRDRDIFQLIQIHKNINWKILCLFLI